MSTTTDPLPKPSENSPAGEGLASSDLFAIDVLSAEFLYRALRPDMSWEINADKPHWEYEAWKLQSALKRLLPQACRYHRGVVEITEPPLPWDSSANSSDPS